MEFLIVVHPTINENYENYEKHPNCNYRNRIFHK